MLARAIYVLKIGEIFESSGKLKSATNFIGGNDA